MISHFHKHIVIIHIYSDSFPTHFCYKFSFNTFRYSTVFNSPQIRHETPTLLLVLLDFSFKASIIFWAAGDSTENLVASLAFFFCSADFFILSSYDWWRKHDGLVDWWILVFFITIKYHERWWRNCNNVGWVDLCDHHDEQMSVTSQ